MMENTLLYTFSTIPQIVAAMIALTAVFIMFRIDILHKRIMGFGQRILDEDQSLLENSQADFMYDILFRGHEGRKRRSRFIGAIRTDADKYLIEQISEAADIENELVENGNLPGLPIRGFNTQRRRVEAISKNKAELISKMKQLVVLSAFSILFPLMCLILVPIICKCLTWSIISLGINFLLASITVIYTVILVRNSIFDGEYEGS